MGFDTKIVIRKNTKNILLFFPFFIAAFLGSRSVNSQNEFDCVGV